MKIPTINDFDFNEKKVLIRTDYNTPMDSEGEITDSKRIKDSIPTIRALLKAGAKKIIIATHIGRPKNNEKHLMTDKACQKLCEILGENVIKSDTWNTSELPEGRIIILENMRFNSSEKSKNEIERVRLGKELSSGADIFVMEAFSNMHRGAQASMTGVMNFIPTCLGLAAENEINTITNAIENPKRPFISIIGGVKADKLGSVKNIMKKADKILLGGALAFSVLSTFGYDMGCSKIDKEGLKEYDDFLKTLQNHENIALPTDCVIADEFSNNANSEIVSIDEVNEPWMALDIGPETIEDYKRIIKEAKTVIWNGPIGVFEMSKFAHGTKEIAKALAESESTSIIGGGDSANAILKSGYKDEVTFVSSGGGASLRMFEGKALPVLEALKKNQEKFNK